MEIGELRAYIFRMTVRTVRKKGGSYEMRVGEASVADTKTRKDDFLPTGGAMRGCPRSRKGFQLGQLVSIGDLFSP